MRVWHPKGGGGRGKSAPLQLAAGPPGPEPPGRPPAAVGGQRQGTRGGRRGTPLPPQPSPPLSPPPRPVGGRRPTGECAAPHPPGSAAAPRGGTPQPRRAQPRAKRAQLAAHSLPQCPLPTAALRRRRGPQRNGGTQECADEAAGLGARPGKAGERIAAKRPPPSPHQADTPAGGQAARGAQGCPATSAERIYTGGVHRRRRGTGTGATGHPDGVGGWGTAAQPPLPSPPHSSPRPTGHGGAGPPPPPRPRGRPPSP